MSGMAHIELTGAVQLSAEVGVQWCRIYSPLDNAYRVNLEPAGALDAGMLTIPRYGGPGAYDYDTPASKPVYPNFEYRILDLRLSQGPKLLEAGDSTVHITVSGDEKSGSATFAGYQTEEGGSVSGTIAWQCDAVEGVVI